MAILKVIEIMASSKSSWEDAANSAVKEASRTLKGIQSVYIKEQSAKVEKGKIVEYVGFSHKPSVALVARCSESHLLKKEDIKPFVKMEVKEK